MKIAVAHDWLQTWAGAEQVLQELLAIYPSAEVFTLVDFLDAAYRERLGGARVHTTFVQRLPGARHGFRKYVPLFPRAIESFDLSGFDVIVSNSHAVAKGVRTTPRQLHVSYCYTPMRYAWDLRDEYLEQVGLSRGVRAQAARYLLERLRRWDRAASARVDSFVAISSYIAERIARAYSRRAHVVYPPVRVGARVLDAGERRAYVTLSRLVPYKRIDVLAHAFRALPDRELVVIGEGPERSRLEALAPRNVRFLGFVQDAERDRLLASARAFVFAADEDFGLAPLEAQAQGTPVIAYARGGVCETITGLDSAAPTGVLFAEQTAECVAQAIRTFEREAARIAEGACVANAKRFSVERFRAEFAARVELDREAFLRNAAIA